MLSCKCEKSCGSSQHKRECSLGCQISQQTSHLELKCDSKICKLGGLVLIFWWGIMCHACSRYSVNSCTAFYYVIEKMHVKTWYCLFIFTSSWWLCHHPCTFFLWCWTYHCNNLDPLPCLFHPSIFFGLDSLKINELFVFINPLVFMLFHSFLSRLDLFGMMLASLFLIAKVKYM